VPLPISTQDTEGPAIHLPSQGILQFTFVDISHPPDGAKPVTDDDLDMFLSELRFNAPSSHRLPATRLVIAENYFTAAQMLKILSFYAAPRDQFDILEAVEGHLSQVGFDPTKQALPPCYQLASVRSPGLESAGHPGSFELRQLMVIAALSAWTNKKAEQQKKRAARQGQLWGKARLVKTIGGLGASSNKLQSSDKKQTQGVGAQSMSDVSGKEEGEGEAGESAAERVTIESIEKMPRLSLRNWHLATQSTKATVWGQLAENFQSEVENQDKNVLRVNRLKSLEDVLLRTVLRTGFALYNEDGKAIPQGHFDKVLGPLPSSERADQEASEKAAAIVAKHLGRFFKKNADAVGEDSEVEDEERGEEKPPDWDDDVNRAQAELYIAMMPRIIDWRGLPFVLGSLSTSTQQAIRQHVGSHVLFDEVCAIGAYKLDLSRHEDCFVMGQLARLSVIEPGENMVGCVLNGYPLDVPAGWATLCPRRSPGDCSVYYCRSNAVINRILSRTPAHTVPPNYAEFQRNGTGWVFNEKKRTIKNRLIDKFDSGEHLFNSIDVDGGGSLSRFELAAGLRSAGVFLDSAEMTLLYASLDEDGSGEIELPEIVEFWNTPCS